MALTVGGFLSGLVETDSFRVTGIVGRERREQPIAGKVPFDVGSRQRTHQRRDTRLDFRATLNQVLGFEAFERLPLPERLVPLLVLDQAPNVGIDPFDFCLVPRNIGFSGGNACQLGFRFGLPRCFSFLSGPLFFCKLLVPRPLRFGLDSSDTGSLCRLGCYSRLFSGNSVTFVGEPLMLGFFGGQARFFLLKGHRVEDCQLGTPPLFVDTSKHCKVCSRIGGAQFGHFGPLGFNLASNSDCNEPRHADPNSHHCIEHLVAQPEAP